jgi:FHA domain/Double zinc ribbon
MIVCPNCKHRNPEGATNCEACYTALPATKACPTCGTSMQLDATFCGQCGQNMQPAESKAPILVPPPAISTPEVASVGLPPTVLTTPSAEIAIPVSTPLVAPEVTPVNITIEPLPVAPVAAAVIPVEPLPVTVLSAPEMEILATPVSTQLPSTSHQLLHLQTNTSVEISPHLQVLYIGKPNDQTPPDLDVSGFPCAEVVSRIHANLRLQEGNYYIEDVGSANGTYINHNILPKGNRHLLRSGDRIGLGKGDLVTFIFE